MPTLDKWFVKRDAEGEKVEPFFTIFFLDGETMKAEWVRKMPKQHTYSNSIKWPALSDDPITIITNIGRSDSDKSSHFVLPSEVIYNNLPYLKSHLQKCIRRSNLNLALKTAHHLARLDLQELLRRLAIIMIEDVILIPEFSTLVWLTAAVSKGYCLDKKRIYWVFGLVTKLATINLRDSFYEEDHDIPSQGLTTKMNETKVTKKEENIESEGTKTTKELKQSRLSYGVSDVHENHEDPIDSNKNDNKKSNKKDRKENETDWKKWRIYKLRDTDKSVIQSLLFRESYGGMKGDKNMLIQAARIWIERFNQGNSRALDFYRKEEIKGPIYVSLPEENLKITDWILAAIDFHVVNNVTMLLADKYETLNYDDIKAAIWHHSSSYTNKIPIASNKYGNRINKEKEKEKSKKAWAIIRPEFYSLASYFLKNNH